MPGMPATTPRRWPLPAVLVAIVITAVLIGAALYIASPPGRQTTGSQPPATTTAATPSAASPTAAPPAAPTGPSLTDGVYEVGRELAAGTYSLTAPADRYCYWARLRSFGRPDSIIDEANLEPGQSALVTVRPTDRGFKVANGCTWHPVL